MDYRQLDPEKIKSHVCLYIIYQFVTPTRRLSILAINNSTLSTYLTDTDCWQPPTQLAN